jgi:hypothetical protein
LSVVKALADSPGNLDFHIWLVWRCWTAKGHVCIPLFGPGGLVQQLGLSNNLRDRDFRRQIRRWLRIVDQLWPECPARLAKNSQGLIVTRCQSQQNSQGPLGSGTFPRDRARTSETFIRDSVRGHA